MNIRIPDDYQEEDFIADESFQHYALRSSKDDVIKWENWLKLHPDKKLIVDRAKQVVMSLSFRLPENEFAEEVGKFRTALEASPIENTNVHSLQRVQRRRWLMVAAIFLLGFLGIAGYFLLKDGTGPTRNEIANQYQSPKEIHMQDGTLVLLAPGSRISYNTNFNENREVFLEGTADFKVSHDAGRPFRVHSHRLTSVVLGTEFQIKQQGDSTVVRLFTGSLKVSKRGNQVNGNHESILLKPGDVAKYDNLNDLLVKVAYQPPVNLNFRQSTFSEIADALHEKFGVHLINTSSRKDWAFTGDFTDTNAIEIVQSICLIRKLKYEINGDTIILK